MLDIRATVSDEWRDMKVSTTLAETKQSGFWIWRGCRALLAGAIALMVVGTLHAAVVQFRAPTRQGSQIRLEWTPGEGLVQLQEAPTPAGPWVDLGTPTDTNSILITPTRDLSFYRGSTSLVITNDAEASMRQTLQAIGAHVSTITAPTPAEYRARVLTFLNGRADIDSAGESPDGVWAITTDGVPLTIWNNRPPDPDGLEEAERIAGLMGTETPGKSPARFSVTVGNGFVHAAPLLGGMLRSNGYQTTRDDGSLETFRGAHSESVYFLNTHGGAVYIPLWGADGKPSRGANGKILYAVDYGLWTGTKIDPLKTDIGYNHNEFVSELKAGRMGVALAPVSYTTGTGGVQSPNAEWHFCITADWVKRYMSFPAENHVSVWLAVCRSGHPDAAGLRSAFRAVGADMVSGWTEDVNGKAVLAATSFVWDRLLGANQIQPPATPQRPFDYDNVWVELRAKGLHRHATVDPQGKPTTTDLIYEGKGGDTTFGLFAPTIEYVLVDESNSHFHLLGMFGQPPAADQKVTVGGTEVGIESWEPKLIRCRVNRSGDASAGDVQVSVRGRKSNVRQVSRWTLTGTYEYKEEDSAHRVDGNMTLIFRADVGEYRKVPGNVFIRPTRSALAGKDSVVFLEAKGIDSSPCGLSGSYREIWSGSGDWKVRGFSDEVVQPFHSMVYLQINSIDLEGSLGIGFGLFDADASPLKVTVEPCEGKGVTVALAPPVPGSFDDPPYFKFPLEEQLPDGSTFEIPLPGDKFIVNGDFSIPAGEMTNPLKAKFKWNAAAVEFPPDRKAAR